MAKESVCFGELDPPNSQSLASLNFVRGMEVDEEEAQFKTEYEGKTYYFCAPGCKTLFEEDPEEYLD